VTGLTQKEQALVRAVRLAGVAAHRAGLARVEGIHFYGHTARQHRFVGDEAMQFSESPRGFVSVGFTGFHRDRLVTLALLLPFVGVSLRAFTDVGQVLQTDETVWVLGNNVMTDLVVRILFQPSLPSTNHHEPSCSGAGAFLLQPLSQSRIVIGFGAYRLAGIERRLMLGGRRHGQVALPYIHAYYLGMALWRGVCSLNFKRDEQVKLFAWVVIPQLGRPDLRSKGEQSHVLVVACVGHDHPPIQGENAYLGVFLQAIISVVVIGECGRDILGSLVKSFVALLGVAQFAGESVLPDPGPQRLVGCSHLARHIAGHLSRQMIDQPYLIVALTLQSPPATHLAMKKRILGDIVQAIAVGQLCFAQGRELGLVRMQFQLSGDELLHTRSIAQIHAPVKYGILREESPLYPPLKDSPFLKRRERRGLLARWVDAHVRRKGSLSIPPSSCRPASVCPYSQRDEYKQDAYAPGKGLPDRRGIRLVEQQPTHRVDNQ
jgi:hypothetical protein